MTVGEFKRPTENDVIKRAHNTWSTLAWQVFPNYEDYLREVLREHQQTKDMKDEDYQKYRKWRREHLLEDIGEFMKRFKFEKQDVNFDGKGKFS